MLVEINHKNKTRNPAAVPFLFLVTPCSACAYPSSNHSRVLTSGACITTGWHLVYYGGSN